MYTGLEEKLALVRSLSDTDGIGYQQGRDEGLVIALGQVRDSPQGIADHDLLQTRLCSLAAELEAGASGVVRPVLAVNAWFRANGSHQVDGAGQRFNPPTAVPLAAYPPRRWA